MPPRRIAKDPKADWPVGADGERVNPNTTEGMMLKGLIAKPPVKGEVPDVLLPEPYTAEVVPCNAAAVMASMPQPENGLLLYKKLPGDCDVFKLHLADEKFPEQEPLVAVTCDTDDLAKVFEALLGDGDEKRYLNPKTGLEFEWTTAPPGFYKTAGGWDEPKVAEDFVEADDEEDDRE